MHCRWRPIINDAGKTCAGIIKVTAGSCYGKGASPITWSTVMGIAHSSHKERESFKTRVKERTSNIPDNLRKYEFPFENLALEGGGCKTYAYLGSLKVLEDLGVLKKIRRFAGASGGAVIATMLAVGYDVRGLVDFFDTDFTKMASDARFGYAAVIPNIIRYFGWNPGNRVHRYLKKSIATKCNGNGDITFQELYDERGVELCVCVSNVTRMGLEYCHPKTTPDMVIADALRKSISVPGFFQPFHAYRNGELNVYVDGGMLCNYPVFAFDGWYLSMEPDDAFLHKLGGDEPPFSTYNDKTIGMVVYATEDAQTLRTGLHARYTGFNLPRPNTPLARKRSAQCDRQLHLLEDRTQMALSAQRFWSALRATDVNRDGKISVTEFLKAVEKVPKDDLKRLFNDELRTTEQFKAMDEDGDNELTFAEFIRFMDKHGLPFRETMEGGGCCRNPEKPSHFAEALLDTVIMMMSKLHMKPQDLHRTIGVHTDYILSSDYEMENDDKEYIIARAEHAAIAFLMDYIANQNRIERNITKP